LPRKGRDEAHAESDSASGCFRSAADLDPIRKLANEFNLKMIEDACEALGAEYKGKPAGTFGDYAVFAFYPNKQITTAKARANHIR